MTTPQNGGPASQPAPRNTPEHDRWLLRWLGLDVSKYPAPATPPPVGQAAPTEPPESVQWRTQNKDAYSRLQSARSRVVMPGPAAAAQSRIGIAIQQIGNSLPAGKVQDASKALAAAHDDVELVMGQPDAAMLPVTPGQHPDQVLFGSETTNDTVHRGPADAPDHPIALEDVNQDGIGDCYLLAVLADIAKLKPALIRGMIQPSDDKGSPDGIYTVTFYQRIGGFEGFFASLFGGKQFKPVQVKVDSNFGTNTVNSRSDQAQVGDKHEIWVQIVEKAYAKLHGGYDKIGSGGLPSNTMPEVTGQPAGSKPINSVTIADLQAALASKTPVVMDTIAPAAPGQRLAFGMAGPHAYVLDNIQVNPQGQAMVSLKNPWGVQNPPPIPFSQISQAVGWVMIGSPL